ncbi:MAG: B12-binding domain-containing radical SAM protein [Candidatus Heimdallarchaeaceae archaeon]
MLIKEQNAIRKEWSASKIKIALVYPNTYRVAMTSLGIQLLYFLFNSWENFLCERVFKPLDHFIQPYSLENQKGLTDFDIIAISCQFEHDYIQAIELLNRGGIYSDTRKRKESDPLIILGGPSITANPFPVLFLADAFFLGDIEPIEELFRNALGEDTKTKRLESLSSIPGMMVLNNHYNNKGEWIGEKVETKKVSDFSSSFYPIKQIIPENVKGTKNEPIFGKAFYLETDRGCSERCLFCFVGHCRFPRIARSLDNLIEIVNQASEVNDFEKVVIYGSAVAQSGTLDELLEHITSMGYEISCSSFRADYVTEKLLKALKKGKQRTITFAPETGDEKLRLALNKKMTNESLFEASKLAWDLGFRNLKLYMMYGFPCEEHRDRESSVKFIEKIRKESFPSGKISISINQFITKANTPFQFSKMLEITTSKEVQKWFKKHLYQMRNINISLYAPEWAIIQRILSLRDHTYFQYIQEIAQMGNTVGNWKKVLRLHNKMFFEEATWNYEVDANLPWDNINQSFKKKHLAFSYKRYLEKRGC